MSDKRPRLEVYLDESILFAPGSPPEVFPEGAPSRGAVDRLGLIRERLGAGFLSEQIKACQAPEHRPEPLDPRHSALLVSLVDSITGEMGRALVGLTVLQLCVKVIAPGQSIRLHKAGGGSANFSWSEGIPMRVLDKNFITPVLRGFDLLKLNADGFMMTRSLAENYPYSRLYKAAIRGSRVEWLELVDLVEAGTVKPEPYVRFDSIGGDGRVTARTVHMEFREVGYTGYGRVGYLMEPEHYHFKYAGDGRHINIFKGR